MTALDPRKLKKSNKNLFRNVNPDNLPSLVINLCEIEMVKLKDLKDDSPLMNNLNLRNNLNGLLLNIVWLFNDYQSIAFNDYQRDMLRYNIFSSLDNIAFIKKRTTLMNFLSWNSLGYLTSYDDVFEMVDVSIKKIVNNKPEYCNDVLLIMTILSKMCTIINSSCEGEGNPAILEELVTDLDNSVNLFLNKTQHNN